MPSYNNSSWHNLWRLHQNVTIPTRGQMTVLEGELCIWDIGQSWQFYEWGEFHLLSDIMEQQRPHKQMISFFFVSPSLLWTIKCIHVNKFSCFQLFECLQRFSTIYWNLGFHWQLNWASLQSGWGHLRTSEKFSPRTSSKFAKLRAIKVYSKTQTLLKMNSQ